MKLTDRHLQGLVGFGLFAASTPCVLAMIHDLVTNAANLEGALMVGGFCTILGVFGVGLMVTALRKPKTPPFEVTRGVEREILSIANGLGGRVTVSDLALRGSLTIDESEAALAHFEQRDIARSQISDDGSLVYVFPHFDKKLDKSTAVDPLAHEIELEFERSAEEDVEEEVPIPTKKQ